MRMVRTSAMILSSGKLGKATDHPAIVQNEHLAVLAGVHGVEHYLLYAHGKDSCYDQELM
jgi:hypothetical protein